MNQTNRRTPARGVPLLAEEIATGIVTSITPRSDITTSEGYRRLAVKVSGDRRATWRWIDGDRHSLTLPSHTSPAYAVPAGEYHLFGYPQ